MEKRERFQKIAVQRTNKIIKMITLLGNCSNKNNYEYSENEVKKIFSAIELELKKTKEKYKSNKKENEFKL